MSASMRRVYGEELKSSATPITALRRTHRSRR